MTPCYKVYYECDFYCTPWVTFARTWPAIFVIAREKKYKISRNLSWFIFSFAEMKKWLSFRAVYSTIYSTNGKFSWAIHKCEGDWFDLRVGATFQTETRQPLSIPFSPSLSSYLSFSIYCPSFLITKLFRCRNISPVLHPANIRRTFQITFIQEL